ncbi:MAG TPA: arsenate reductase ArsC [Candidatus Acidoferrum sp.]|nr:arsenate reductase ArsC [Candidatus Acidoferrum sp.]
MSKTKVLFLCTHNSARSQIAEGLLRFLYGDEYEVFSAGTSPTQINPLAITVMDEIGIDISQQYSKSLDVFKNADIDLVVSVCRSSSKINCAICSSPMVMGRPELIRSMLPKAKDYLEHPFEDPSEVQGTEEEKLEAFRHTRNEMKKWIVEKFSYLSKRALQKPKVIFLCTRNSARSQMAEAFLKKYAGDHFEVYSAGFDPQPINPYAFQVMKELGFDLSNQQPKDLAQFLGKVHFGIIITVCARAEEECPTIPGVGTRIYWPFEDPVAFQGTEEEKLAKFREIRDKINERIEAWLKERGIVEN